MKWSIYVTVENIYDSCRHATINKLKHVGWFKYGPHLKDTHIVHSVCTYRSMRSKQWTGRKGYWARHWGVISNPEPFNRDHRHPLQYTIMLFLTDPNLPDQPCFSFSGWLYSLCVCGSQKILKCALCSCWAYRDHKQALEERLSLSSMLAASQSDMPPRSMKHSSQVVHLPLGSQPKLREKYLTHHNTVR